MVKFKFPTHQFRNSFFTFVADLVLLFVSLQLYVDAGGKKFDNSYWYAEVSATTLIIIGLFTGDALIGFAAHPEMSLYKINYQSYRIHNYGVSDDIAYTTPSYSDYLYV